MKNWNFLLLVIILMACTGCPDTSQQVTKAELTQELKQYAKGSTVDEVKEGIKTFRNNVNENLNTVRKEAVHKDKILDTLASELANPTNAVQVATIAKALGVKYPNLVGDAWKQAALQAMIQKQIKAELAENPPSANITTDKVVADALLRLEPTLKKVDEALAQAAELKSYKDQIKKIIDAGVSNTAFDLDKLPPKERHKLKLFVEQLIPRLEKQEIKVNVDTGPLTELARRVGNLEGTQVTKKDMENLHNKLGELENAFKQQEKVLFEKILPDIDRRLNVTNSKLQQLEASSMPRWSVRQWGDSTKTWRHVQDMEHAPPLPPLIYRCYIDGRIYIEGPCGPTEEPRPPAGLLQALEKHSH